MKLKIIESIHGQDFVVIDPVVEHLEVILWLTSTQLRVLKMRISGFSNTVARVERYLDGTNSPMRKGVYWTNSWVWTSLVSQQRDKFSVAAGDCYHYPFDENASDIELDKGYLFSCHISPPIPKFLFSLYVLENRDKFEFSILGEEPQEKDAK